MFGLRNACRTLNFLRFYFLIFLIIRRLSLSAVLPSLLILLQNYLLYILTLWFLDLFNSHNKCSHISNPNSTRSLLKSLHPLSMLHAFKPLPLEISPIGILQQPLTMLLPLQIVPIIMGSVTSNLFPHSIYFIIFPISLNLLLILCLKNSKPFHHVVSPIPFIIRSVFINKPSSPVYFSVFPIPTKDGAIISVLLSKSLSGFIYHIPLPNVNAAVF